MISGTGGEEFEGEFDEGPEASDPRLPIDDAADEPVLQSAPKLDGRTREAKAAKAAVAAGSSSSVDAAAQVGAVPPRAQTRRTARQTGARAPTHQPMRSATGRIAVYGRDGELLTRTRTDVGDMFHIPEELKERGWDYQWIPISVTGNNEVVLDMNNQMYANGWRPVPSERPGFAGYFHPITHKGPILRGSQGLFERPAVLSEESRNDDIKKARQQVKDRDESLMGRKANLRDRMPVGFELSGRRGTGADVRVMIDRSSDIPTPGNYLPADDTVA